MRFRIVASTELPDRPFLNPRVQPPFAKILPLSPHPTHLYIPRRPFAHSARIYGHKGRIAIVTDAGLDAVDAAALGAQVNCRAGFTRERSNGVQTNDVKPGEAFWRRRVLRTVKTCGSGIRC
jgi:hypothetical protein